MKCLVEFFKLLYILSQVFYFATFQVASPTPASPDELGDDRTKERIQINGCRREETAGVSAAAGGQSSTEESACARLTLRERYVF